MWNKKYEPAQFRLQEFFGNWLNVGQSYLCRRANGVTFFIAKGPALGREKPKRTSVICNGPFIKLETFTC